MSFGAKLEYEWTLLSLPFSARGYVTNPSQVVGIVDITDKFVLRENRSVVLSRKEVGKT